MEEADLEMHEVKEITAKRGGGGAKYSLSPSCMFYSAEAKARVDW